MNVTVSAIILVRLFRGFFEDYWRHCPSNQQLNWKVTEVLPRSGSELDSASPCSLEDEVVHSFQESNKSDSVAMCYDAADDDEVAIHYHKTDCYQVNWTFDDAEIRSNPVVRVLPAFYEALLLKHYQ